MAQRIHVTVTVLDINNNAPDFNQSVYTAWVREKGPAGTIDPFSAKAIMQFIECNCKRLRRFLCVLPGSAVTRVFALDKDDPSSPNAALYYSLVSQIPNEKSIAFFQINHETGAISTTEQGEPPPARTPDAASAPPGEVSNLSIAASNLPV